ncbi:hypothetical protein, partial [Mesorhizobium sp. M1A.T.Ca.IN.004.03.1.1]|uniref:hypothetical protein n=1 Tax=Mesorhizobium sp. M1A.T.Ca.IN.004.03.1.1 TaxID=2496795 RepID=UPI0019D3162D
TTATLFFVSSAMPTTHRTADRIAVVNLIYHIKMRCLRDFSFSPKRKTVVHFCSNCSVEFLLAFRQAGADAVADRTDGVVHRLT